MVRILINGTEALGKVSNELKSLQKRTNDLRPAFEIVASDFYVSNQPLIFSARPGKFADLKPRTKESKIRRLGSPYPVLVDSKRTLKAFTTRGSGDNITIIQKALMALGSIVPWNVFLQEGTSRMPARPPIIIDVGGRLRRWISIISSYAMKGKTGG